MYLYWFVDQGRTKILIQLANGLKKVLSNLYRSQNHTVSNLASNLYILCMQLTVQSLSHLTKPIQWLKNIVPIKSVLLLMFSMFGGIQIYIIKLRALKVVF